MKNFLAEIMTADSVVPLQTTVAANTPFQAKRKLLRLMPTAKIEILKEVVAPGETPNATTHPII